MNEVLDEHRNIHDYIDKVNLLCKTSARNEEERIRELCEKINWLLKPEVYYTNVEYTWNLIDALINFYFPNAVRMWISEGMDEYAELIISKEANKIYLLVITTKAELRRITPITDTLYYYLLNADSWKVLNHDC